MNEQQTQELYDLGPTLYRQRALPMTESCMCWGFDGIGPGWFDLLRALTITLERHNRNRARRGEDPIEAGQVKEKFGGLRFYADGCDEFAAGAIAMAETLSERTCIECGRPGEIRPGGWLTCLCEEHAE